MPHGREALKLKITVPPSSEPVTLAEVKAQMRIDESDTSLDDTIVPLLIAAREWCEEYQSRSYISQTIELVQDEWPYGDEIRLPRPPIQTVSAVTYAGTSGAITTVSTSSYLLDNVSEPGYLVTTDCWPAESLQVTNAIKVVYVAGYGTASAVPQRIKQAIMLLTCHWFDNGMCDPPRAVLSLLNLDRVMPV
jgi:uncharacterized phiE125 gp8 family phage protein